MSYPATLRADCAAAGRTLQSALPFKAAPVPRVYVRPEVYHAGLDEFGTPFHAVRYVIVAELPSGARWVHYRGFNGCQRWTHPDDGFDVFEDIRPSALAQARRLINRIRPHLRAGGRLDMSCWHEAAPAYGSEAYIRTGQSRIDALAERAAG